MMADHTQDVATIAAITSVPTILEVVCKVTGMGFAAVARVTDDRWVACGVRDEIAFGLQPGGELRVETTICNEIRGHREPVVIDNVAEDGAFCQHPTPAMYGFQSYISMPIILPDGSFFGTLCAIDPKPRTLNNPSTIGMVKLFADLVGFHIDAHEKLTRSREDLARERRDADLREQFIAVLGHDLRNPLASIEAGTRLVLKAEQTEKSRSILTSMQRSIGRMSELIDNVLDFARSRLGDGMALDRRANEPLAPALEHVIDELRAAHPERVITAALSIESAVDCDHSRIGQLLSNLVANALTHGYSTTPVRVAATTAQGSFEISVSNQGEPIPPRLMNELFKPFVRATSRPNQQGLGLGLYIASEIARAHGGTLDAVSAGGKTTFSFRMPMRI